MTTFHHESTAVLERPALDLHEQHMLQDLKRDAEEGEHVMHSLRGRHLMCRDGRMTFVITFEYMPVPDGPAEFTRRKSHLSLPHGTKDPKALVMRLLIALSADHHVDLDSVTSIEDGPGLPAFAYTLLRD